MKLFDSIIIGSGQAGTPLVFSLAAKGKKVAFIEKKQVGGTCLNVGCTPTKTYVASARRMWDLQHAGDMGVNFEGSFTANINAIKKRKDDLIAKSVTGIRSGLSDNENITFIEGEAKFISNYQVEVNGEQLTAQQIFINVGGRAIIPEEYQGMNVLTNENILDLTELPEHLIIICGSYIGLEFGQMFRRFGSKITIIERGENIISREDEEVSKTIQTFMEADGVEFILNATSIAPAYDSNTYTVTINNSQKIKGTHLLLAIGRLPNTDLLQLQNTSLQTDQRGFITVNDFCQTSVEGIFALGDCNGKGAFTHTAYNDYQVVENFLFGDGSRKISDRIMTYGLFVDPPLGRAGMTKKDALAKGIKLLEGKREMSRIARAKEKGETYGFIQVLVNADTNKIIGACVLGTGGDEIITSLLNIMSAGVDYTLIRDTMVLHPTISELIPTTLENLKEIS